MMRFMAQPCRICYNHTVRKIQSPVFCFLCRDFCTNLPFNSLLKKKNTWWWHHVIFVAIVKIWVFCLFIFCCFICPLIVPSCPLFPLMTFSVYLYPPVSLVPCRILVVSHAVSLSSLTNFSLSSFLTAHLCCLDFLYSFVVTIKTTIFIMTRVHRVRPHHSTTHKLWRWCWLESSFAMLSDKSIFVLFFRSNNKRLASRWDLKNGHETQMKPGNYWVRLGQNMLCSVCLSHKMSTALWDETFTCWLA